MDFDLSYFDDEQCLSFVNEILRDSGYHLKSLSDIFKSFNYPAFAEAILEKRIAGLERRPTEFYQVIENRALVNQVLIEESQKSKDNPDDPEFQPSDDPRTLILNLIKIFFILQKYAIYKKKIPKILRKSAPFGSLTNFMPNFLNILRIIYPKIENSDSSYENVENAFKYAEIPFIIKEEQVKDRSRPYTELIIMQLHFLLKYFDENGQLNSYKKIQLRKKLISLGFLTPESLNNMLRQLKRAFFAYGCNSYAYQLNRFNIDEDVEDEEFLKTTQINNEKIQNLKTAVGIGDSAEDDSIFTINTPSLEEPKAEPRTKVKLAQIRKNFSSGIKKAEFPDTKRTPLQAHTKSSPLLFRPVSVDKFNLAFSDQRRIYLNITHAPDYVGIYLFQKYYEEPNQSVLCYYPLYPAFQGINDHRQKIPMEILWSFNPLKKGNYCLDENNISKFIHDIDQNTFYFTLLGNDENGANDIITHLCGGNKVAPVPSNTCIVSYKCESTLIKQTFYILRVSSPDNSLPLTDRIFFEQRLVNATKYHIVVNKSAGEGLEDALSDFYKEFMFENDNSAIYITQTTSNTSSSKENYFYYKSNNARTPEIIPRLQSFMSEGVTKQKLQKDRFSKLFSEGMEKKTYSDILSDAFMKLDINYNNKIAVTEFYKQRFVESYPERNSDESIRSAHILALSHVYNTFYKNNPSFYTYFLDQINGYIDVQLFAQCMKESFNNIKAYCEKKILISPIERRSIIESFKLEAQKTIIANIINNSEIPPKIVPFFPLNVFDDEINEYVEKIKNIFADLDQQQKENSNQEDHYNAPMNYVMRENVRMNVIHIAASQSAQIPPDY